MPLSDLRALPLIQGKRHHLKVVEGVDQVLFHTHIGMPVIPEERLRCSASYSASVVWHRWKPSLGRIEESLEEVEKITLPYFRVFLGLPTSGPSPPQKEENPATYLATSL